MILNTHIINEIDKVSEIAGYLWERGWSERNAGNFSVDLTGMIDIQEIDVNSYEFVPAEIPDETAAMTFFITGTGEHLRDLRTDPQKSAAIIHIDEKANGYRILWGAEGDRNFRPTSELMSHFKIHLYNKAESNRRKCIVHTHPIELIAISHHEKLGKDEELLNKSLWSMLPEIRVFVPRGISLLPYKLPGSIELAQSTVEGLKNRDVVLWSKHGALATGKDAVEAFDFLDVANKAAIIYLKCLQAGYTPEGLSDEQLKDLEQFIE